MMTRRVSSFARPRLATLLSATVLFATVQACSCDPAETGDDDAGVVIDEDPDAGAAEPDEDAGAQEEDAGAQEEDAGPPPPPRLLAMQADNGVLVVVDVDTGALRYPFGRTNANGGLASTGDALLTFSEAFIDSNLSGHIISYDPASGAVEQGPLGLAAPMTIATDGSEIAVSHGNSSTILIGSFDADSELAEHPTTYVGSSVAYDANELVVSVTDGLRLTESEQTIASTRRCTGLAYDASDDSFLCADSLGEGLWSIARDGSETQVDASVHARFTSLTLLADGGYLAPSEDCSVLTDVTLPTGLDAFCPQQFAELGGGLFFTAQNGGGLYEIDDAGALWLRLASPSESGGLASGQGQYAVAGSEPSHILIANADGSEPWLTARIGSVRGLAFDDAGGLWAARGSNLLYFAGAPEAEATIPTADFLEDIVRVGDHLYLAVRESVVQRLLLSDGVSATIEDTALPTPTLIGGCDAGLIFYDENQDVIGSLVGDTEETLVADASLTLGELTGVGCFDDLLLVGSSDGKVWTRPLAETGDLVELAELDSAARRFSVAAE